MKKNNIQLLTIICLLLLPFLESCEDAKYDDISAPHIYMYARGGENSERVSVEGEGSIVSLSVRLNKAISEPVNANLKIDEKFLEQYNSKNGTSFVLLPEDYFAFDSMDIEIPKEEIAKEVNISLKPLSSEMNKTGLTYVIPVTISSVKGNKAEILRAGESYLYIVSPIPYADVPILTRGRGMKMFLKEDKMTFTDFTVEFLVKIDNLGLNRNNQIAFNGRTADGKNEIFTRFAADGAAGKWDKFQIKNQGLNFDAEASFENNKWYHIAFVNNAKTGKSYIYVNGVLDSSFDNPGLPTTIESNAGNGIRFCGEEDNDSYMRSNMQGAEIRLWSVARTASEVQNNMYGIDPSTQGLVAYWKSNEGEGAVIKDQTGNGNDGVIFGNPVWNLNQRVQVGWTN